MRIAIREQLALLVLLAVLIALAVVSIPTWIYVHKFVVGVGADGLALTASLKAARISSEIELVQTSCQSIASRILIQKAMNDFYHRNNTDDDWPRAAEDIDSALSTSSTLSLFQCRIWARNDTAPYGLLNVTGSQTPPIELPYTLPDGTRPLLGDTEGGYPSVLYPNITYNDTGVPNRYAPTTNMTTASAFPDVRLSNNGGLVLGPLIINESFALISLTVPVRANGNHGYILGYQTFIASAASLIDIQTSREGLGKTGVVLLIGPSSPSNRFNASDPASNSTYVPRHKKRFGRTPVHFILPPVPAPGHADRHTEHNYASGNFDGDFPLSSYPVVLKDFSERINTINNASADLSSTNEEGHKVAVGFARPQTTLVNWTVVIEQEKSEAYATINTLREILLGCVFGTAGVTLLFIIPCAHLGVMPIRRLKEATEKSIMPPGYYDEIEQFDLDDEEGQNSAGVSQRSKHKTFVAWLARKAGYNKRLRSRPVTDADSNRRVFKIPGKVDNRKHLITDELTELTETFNAMSDELLKQYTQLDEKVAQRTRELEISKKAAEAANESKTLFIANISHELKTPLNGIMGMCAVCMEESDINRIKQSLKTLYKSGDLLLHLLEDLLSFSKNQIGQQVRLEEREFRLGDIRSQMLSIFDKQVREGRIVFTVQFIGFEAPDAESNGEANGLERKLPALGPPGMGRLKDVCLWGDQHRILQVMINLVSNSLKFTPPGGKVDLRIRCVGEAEPQIDESRTSSFSKNSNRASRSRHRVGSGSTHSVSSKGGAASPGAQALQKGTALSINPLDPKAMPHIRVRERSPTPPPPNARTFLFEFEVQDTGPGIPEHMQQRVFEPFVQGDLGLSKKFGGTGLGLSICSQLATLMGGTIDLKSTLGAGTSFTMQIPLKYVKDRSSSTASSSAKGSRPPSVGSADGDSAHRGSLGKPATADPKAVTTASVLDTQPRLVGLRQPFFASTPHPGTPSKEDQMAAIDRAMANKTGQGKLRVLVADDNSTNVEVVSRLLKLEDVYDVTIAKDGQEAYDLVKANMEINRHFDVIFMDIQMPNLDGLQSTRLIRKMGYNAPIVALTAFSEESNVKECMESGMDEFLSKPIRRPALKQVLQKFATIPEEPETTSLTRRSTPDKAEPAPTLGAPPGYADDAGADLGTPGSPAVSPFTKVGEAHSNGTAGHGVTHAGT